MKRIVAGSLLVLSSVLTAGAEQLVPAGSVLQCTISEPKISSKTENIGDPVLCQLSHVELYGRSTVPYGAYLVGRFEDYKDPGHLVGKGWMELKFDRLVVDNDTIVPVSLRVVEAPNYKVDQEGRILGKGHAKADTVEWLLPVLWPIDLINLPRRGPRPVLKAESRLTLKVIDDFGVPTKKQYEREHGLQERSAEAAAADAPPVQLAPVVQAYQQAPAVQQSYASQPPQTVIYNYAPQAQYAPQPQYPPQQVAVPYPVPYGVPYPVPAPRPYPVYPRPYGYYPPAY